MKAALKSNIEIRHHCLHHKGSFSNFYAVDYKLIRIKNAVGFVSIKGVINEIKGKGIIYIPCHSQVTCSVQSANGERVELDILSFKKDCFHEIVEVLKPFVVYSQFNNVSQMYFQYNDEFDPEFDSLLEIQNGTNQHKDTISHALSQTIIYKIVSKYASHLLTCTHDEQCIVKLISEIITNDLTKKWKLAEIATVLNMSVSTLQRKLNDEDVDFTKLLIDLKLSKARDFLTYSSIPITQVANKSGFENLAYFSNSFKKHFKMTPTHFRRSVKGS
ncbi:hypothetical protein A3K86_02130 [Photobacterium jeanii]|uniref:HTH araC/xylS-type domain-containing protein n=1 Tax=Photobacterium jeanii TaxID=858640 RepID=A0A178KKJ2_9GAMM|nr:AraC family transcriptional regulator [Photobacterium jeanii]OAN17740.1 hypothetical protein A3K86_02130 [Photobacterium jeanii]PST92598.1 AraC family transcriptional regulator [Photobacterium jeanii]